MKVCGKGSCAWALATLVTVLATPVLGHGIWGHVHVTGWAVENLPEGELKAFLSDPDVFNALLFGAAYTDSGYFVTIGEDATAGRAYAEHSHWEPFIADYIAAVSAAEEPPFETLESRQRVAFMMGVASHGLQDEIFDSLFLYQVEEHDDAGQSEADPGSDGFLALDGHIRFDPQEYLPLELLLPLYTDVDEGINAGVIEAGVSTMAGLYLNHGFGLAVAESNGQDYLPILPWTAEHYLDPEIPGSLVSEVEPTMHYIEAIWERLHGRYTESDLVIHAYPASPRRLLSHEVDTPDAWATLIFGMGIGNGTATASWVDDAETPVAFTRRDTRWTNSGWSRLMRFQPTEALAPGASYTIALEPGAALINDTTVALTHSFRFQVECTPETVDDCPDLGEIPVPNIDGPPEPEPFPMPEPGAEMVDLGGRDADLGADTPSADADTDALDGPLADVGATADAEPADSGGAPAVEPTPGSQPASSGSGCSVAASGRLAWPGTLICAGTVLWLRRHAQVSRRT